MVLSTIGAIGGAVGGLAQAFGGRDRSKTNWGQLKTQRRLTREHFELVRQGAEAAGFNPLTALRSGAGSPPSAIPAAALSSGEAVLSGLGAGLQYLGQIDPMVRERARLETELMRTQLETAQHNLDMGIRQAMDIDRKADRAPIASAPVANIVQASPVTYEGPAIGPEVATDVPEQEWPEHYDPTRPRVPVYTPYGDRITLPENVADMHQLRPGDVIPPGLWEETMGQDWGPRTVGMNPGRTAEVMTGTVGTLVPIEPSQSPIMGPVLNWWRGLQWGKGDSDE